MKKLICSLCLALLLTPGLALAGNTTNSGYATAPQPLYSLPGDHRFHLGEFYSQDVFHEWHYFTMLGKDLDTGEDISFFWCIFQTAFDPKREHPFNSVILAYHIQNTGEFWSAANHLGGKLVAKGTNPDDPNFHFSYSMKDPVSAWTTDYKHASESWRFTGSSTNDKLDGFKENDPYVFDVTMQVQKPGYLPAAYFGLEAIGYTPGYRQNPETTWGLTRYYTSSKSIIEGTIEIGGKKRRIKGDGWFEHQWGNYTDVEKARYFWGYMRLNDGRAFTWRQYYKTPDFGEYDAGMTRFQVVNPDGAMEYAFGPSFVYKPTKWWKSPISGKKWPWWGEMETPIGKFYFGPKWPSQESGTISYSDLSFIEGCAYIRSGSPDGPIVGTGFVEIVDTPGGVSAPKVFGDRDLRLKIDDMNR